MNEPIRFDDGAAYERYMGRWSQLTGHVFLEWLNPPPAVRWLDVGCGNGAFTEMIANQCAPSSLEGIDPSAKQLAYARARPSLAGARFHQADAMELPFPDNTFDAAVMPLVVFFVPDPARGVAEMARVVRPDGWVAAYAWDMAGDGFPYEPLRQEMRALGSEVPSPPSTDSSSTEALSTLWQGARLVSIETRRIRVQRVFDSFDEYWQIVHQGPSVQKRLAAMTPENHSLLRLRMRERLTTDASGRIVCSATANAIVGRVTADS